MSMHPITVTPTKNGNGVFEWTVTYGKDSGKKPGEYPVVKLKHGGTNERFRITLVDPEFGITFSDDPIWVQVGSCPITAGIDKDLIDKVDTDSTIVRFRDLNSNDQPLSLWYRLNFNVPGLNPGDPGTFLDPEIKNGGGGGPGVGILWVTLGIAGACGAAYLAYEAFLEH